VVTLAGSVYCWGNNDHAQLGELTTAKNCVVSGGNDPNTGTCSGTPLKVTFPANAGPMVRVFAGGDVSCALDNVQHGYCWGDDDHSQIGNGGGAVPFLLRKGAAAPYTFDDLAVGRLVSPTCGRTDSDIFCWGTGTGTLNGTVQTP
jgi:hypothetical protein